MPGFGEEKTVNETWTKKETDIPRGWSWGKYRLTMDKSEV